MKKILTSLVCCLLTLQLFAQAPQRLSYQAIVRNANNVLVTNAPIRMRISILQGSISGTTVYSELHSTTTNASGVAFVEVGGGTSPVGSFATINWGQGPYFLRSETDPNNGTNYSIVGTTQLLSVPYALQSNRAARADSSTHATRAGNGLPTTTAYGALQLFNCNGVVQYTPCLPRLTTAAMDSIALTTAVSGGNISADGGAAVTARGVVWSTVSNPTVSLATKTTNGTGTGAFKSNLTGLAENTSYFVRAYATSSAGTAYGNELTFRTLGRLPIVTTNTISAITANTATGGGNVTDSGSARVTARGIVWSTSQNPTIALTTRTTNGTGIGSFSSSITGLISDSLYYVRAYATTSAGTAYGQQVSFRAGRLPLVTTTAISAITATTATGGGNVTDSGSARVTARGIVWSNSQNPTIALTTRTTNGTGIGSFTSSITGLVSDSIYYVRAYATTSVGTAYGQQVSFRAGRLPVVTTTAISAITANTATGGGNVTDSGSAAVTARGVVWSTSQNPTIALTTRTTNGTGIGSFTSSITGLLSGVTYFVRAYATSTAGTAYGAQVSFTTLSPYAAGTVHCNNTPTAIVEVTNPATGRVWMDRNLGATRVAVSTTDSAAYGDLYQWGRRADGHQCRNSATTTVLSTTDQPANGSFIFAAPSTFDWRNPSNNNLWQGVSGINNPCPTGFRLPTEAEMNQEMAAWTSNNTAGAFASPLKWASAGYRADNNGALANVGAAGNYWVSSINGGFSRNIFFYDAGAGVTTSGRATGSSVRCLRDALPPSAAVASLACSTATHNGALLTGIAASRVNSVVAYTGGNGATYIAQTINSTGVTGLTATLSAGTLAIGAGTLTYTITGTPATSGTASFALNIGGQSCTLSRSVENAPNTVTDASGNTYPTVTIGTQVWMAENLRTTKYRDGSNIPVVTDNTQWANNFNTGATSPMMCWYNNDQATYTANKFGALYNWYAINPATNGNKNVCPTGWHVPTDAEWNILIANLDPSYNPMANGSQSATAGGKMKSTGTQYWISPNTGATNSSGWSGLPGGYRYNDGTFLNIGYVGSWWSSTENDTNDAWARDLFCSSGAVYRNYYLKSLGFSVRCLRD